MMAGLGIVIGTYASVLGITRLVQAFTETTKQMPTDFAFNLTGYDSGSGLVVASASEVRLATSSAWWNPAFSYKKEVTLKNIASAIATAGATIQITLDTKALVDAGKLQTSGNDLRVVYATQSGSFTELPRQLIPAAGQTVATSVATNISFPLQATMSATATTSAYMLYYGNSTVSAPTFPKEKYLSFDGADDYVKSNTTNLEGMSNGTVAFWVQPKGRGTYSGNNQEAKFALGNSRPQIYGTGYVYMHWGGASDAYPGGVPISDNQWTYVVMTWTNAGTEQANGEVKLYLNNELKKAVSGLTLPFNDHSGVMIGGTGQSPLNGYMDNVQIWDRALSTDEMAQAMNRGVEPGGSLWNGLKAYWKMDEGAGQTVADATGNGNDAFLGTTSSAEAIDPTWVTGTMNAYDLGSKHATLVCPFNGTTNCLNGVTPAVSTGAIRYASGSAMRFDRLDDSITTPLDLDQANAWTYSFWMKLNSNLTGTVRIADGGANNPRILAGAGGVIISYTNADNVYKSAIINVSAADRIWHQYTLVWDGISSLILYKDGTAYTYTITDGIYDDSNKVRIGSYNGTKPIDGSLDEFVVYDRALSSAEVTAMYNGGAGKYIEPDSSTKLLYHFDENGSDPRYSGKVIDSSGNGNHGTNSGAFYVDGIVSAGSTANHSGVVLEEGVVNRVYNPSFESNSTDSWTGKSAFNYTSTQTDVDGNTLLASNQVKDVFYYDTTRDADGGAWRNNSTAQASSWWNEAFSTTRGKKQEFPEKAWIVASKYAGAGIYGGVDIIDAVENKLWMRFSATAYGALGDATTGLSVTALNGSIYVGSTSTTAGTRGLHTINFVTGAIKASSSSVAFSGVFQKSIALRNDNTGTSNWSQVQQFALINFSVNDVATVVVNGKTYVAAATEGGVTLINETDGGSVNFYQTGVASNKSNQVFFTPTGDLYYSYEYYSTGAAYRELDVFYVSNPSWTTGTSTAISSASYRYYTYIPGTGVSTSTPAFGNTDGPNIKSIYVTPGTSTIDGTSNTIYVGHNGGVTVIQEKRGDESNGSSKIYTKDYVSEEMLGDVRGMWDFGQNATLSDTDTVSRVSPKGTDLISVGGATVASGVRGNAFQFNGTSQYLKQKAVLDQTGATWGTTTNSLSLATGSAFFRAGETLGSELLSNTGFETAGAGGADVFGTWSETANDGSIERVTTPIYSGTYAAKLTQGTSEAKMSQGITVTGSTRYKVTVWSRGDGTNSGRIRIYDNINSSYILNSTSMGNADTAYKQYSVIVTTPSTCTDMSVVFASPATQGGITYVDEVTVKAVSSPNLSTYVGTDSGSTPHMLVVKDSAGREAWGYIGAADAGESLGSELITNGDFSSWSGDNPGNWTVSEDVNNYVTQNGGAARIVSNNTMAVSMSQAVLSIEKLYKYSFNVVSISGICKIGNASVGTVDITSSGLKTGYFTSLENNWYFKRGGVCDMTIDDVSVKEVLHTQQDGVHIMTGLNGTSRGWAAFDPLFYRNGTSYTFEVRRADLQTSSTSFTLGAWIKTSASGGEILSRFNQNVAAGIHFNVASGVLKYSNGAAFSLTGTRTVSDNAWHHVMYVQTSTADHKLYVDGALDASSTTDAGTSNGGVTPFMIGAAWSSGTPTSYFSGLIDEPFFTLKALSETQVLDMYNKGLGALNHTTKTDQKLVGTSASVTGVWASSDGKQIYAATGGAGGAVSVIKAGKVGDYTDSDSVTKGLTTLTTPSLISNDSVALAVANPSLTVPTMVVGSSATGASAVTTTPQAVTRTTTAPYYKYGSAALNIDNSASALAAPYTFADTLTAAAYTLSFYAYNNGYQVTSSDVLPYVQNVPIASASAYIDAGGGWTRVVKNFTATTSASLYGVQVAAGKNVYVDGVQLEQRTTDTSYIDGSLGANYSWSGTVHNSTSYRSPASLTYPNTNVLNHDSGTVVLWAKPDHAWNDATWTANNPAIFANYSGGSTNRFIRMSSTTGKLQFVIQGNNVYDYQTYVTPPSDKSWIQVALLWDKTTQKAAAFVNGVKVNSVSNLTMTSSAFSDSTFQVGSNFGGTISDLRIYDQPLTDSEIALLYQSGLTTHQTTDKVDKYVSTGTYTSAPLDLGANGQWGIVPFGTSSVLNGGSISYQTRTSPDGSAWGNWAPVTGTAVASDPRRYLQWQAVITASGDGSNSPVITGMTTSYVEDTEAPHNPETTALGYINSASASATLVSANWANAAHPKFTWEAGTDTAALGQSSSGIGGYHVVLTTDAAATPSALTTNSCYRYAPAGERTFVVGTAPTGCVLQDGVYYLRLQAQDNSGNKADPVTLFTYKYDGTIPSAPTSISSTTVGYSASSDFTFFWPAAVDAGPSGLRGYEYKTATTSGALSDWQFTTGTQVSGVVAYQEGQNLFYVRSVDVAGNASGATSNNVSIAPFYFSSSAPTAPRNVAISPSTSSGSPAAENVFSVSWDKPASYSGDIAKYYYCVNCTPSDGVMTETTATETVNRALTTKALATQQGKNTFYIVAEDNTTNTATGHGNRNYEAYMAADFYASTIAPGAPTSLTVSDVSDRAASQWRITLAWKASAVGGTPAHYDIYRKKTSEDAHTKIGTTTSSAYTDADLSQSETYSYYVQAVDNAGSISLASNTVTAKPEGRFGSPPTTGGSPNVSTGSSTAIITWTTSRSAFGSVDYGKTTDFGSTSSESVSATAHSVKLTGLSPGTTYNYRVQSLDDSNLVGYERTDAYSDTYTFSTMSRPDIGAITASDITLDSALISWTTTSMSTSVIDYGASTDYGQTITVSTTASSSAHMAKLSGLTHSTSYHFRVKGTTADGTDVYSEDNVFQTLTFPKVTATVFNTDQGANGTSIVVAWGTNVATTGIVEYQPVTVETSLDLAHLQALDQAALVKLPIGSKGVVKSNYDGTLASRHVARLNGLSDGTMYVVTIRGRDKNGLEAVAEPWRYVTGNDTRPPVMSNVVVETPLSGVGADAKAQLLVSWETDEPALGQLVWGKGTGAEYPQASELESAPGTKHVIVLRDLDPTTTFHFKIVSTDVSKNKAESEDTVIVTPAAQQAALDVIFKNLNDIFGFLKL